MGWQGILYRRIYVDFSFLTVHKVCTKARLLGDQTLLPYGTVIYIEDVGIRIVQDRGNAVQGNHLDVAVSGSHEDALNWDGYGEHQVWIIKEAG